MTLKRMPGRIARLEISRPPPSVNDMYVPIGRGRSILSEAGRQWKKLASDELARQVGIISKPSFWRLDVLIPGAGAAIDLPNYEKALTDALVKAEKVPDDRYLVDYRFRFHSGNTVAIVVKTEEITKWANIKKTSKSLMKKLARSLA